MGNKTDNDLQVNDIGIIKGDDVNIEQFTPLDIVDVNMANKLADEIESCVPVPEWNDLVNLFEDFVLDGSVDPVSEFDELIDSISSET